ncbi:MAG: type II secretion system protein [Planctomycetota bacterium]
MESKQGQRDRKAFTLVEVVVGCVLLATLLVSTLLATSRYRNQIARAQRRQQAVYLADMLLASWWDSQKGIPLAESGFVADPLKPSSASLSWQTSVVSSRNVLGVVHPVVRLQVFDRSGRSELVAIEVLGRASGGGP